MKTGWHNVKNVLVIRPDNMGDIIMMTPALKAIKSSFDCRLTILTSKMGSLITPYIQDIDETIEANVPWVKTNAPADAQECTQLIKKLQSYHFDAAIISTVYSQNPLPAAMLAMLSGIPRRLAYCRENPYELLTDWVPENEPLEYIEHQVTREMRLLEAIGINAAAKRLSLYKSETCWKRTQQKLFSAGIKINKPWLIIHPGVSEIKREYPLHLWIKTVQNLSLQDESQILVTGSKKDKNLADAISQANGKNVFSIAGLLSIGEFISLIAHAEAVVSVNTATVHIAAAVNTPVVVLYAQTNPQHTPWLVPSVVLPFSIPKRLQSKNAIIQFVNHKYYADKFCDYPTPSEISSSVAKLLEKKEQIAIT